MKTTIERVGDVSLVVLDVPALDASNHNEFKATMAPILAGSSKVILDISEVKFIDSSGLGSVLSCQRKMHAAGGDLKLLCGISKPVRLFFELVRIHGILNVFNSRQEALNAFASDPAHKK